MKVRGGDEGIHLSSIILFLLLCSLIAFILNLLKLCFSFVCLGLRCSLVKINVLVF